ncbi:MAG: polysaccharide biosynthesis C-terminal domain-containing protein [Lachnospiraceae bacterium]
MSNKSNLIRNTSFLLIAAIISKVIGVLYRSPLDSIVGSVGMGYSGYAQTAYFLLLVISSFSIPQAVSIIMSDCLTKGEYKNAQRVFRGSLLYVVVVGGIAALFCFFGAQIMLPSNMTGAIPALRILAPTIFLSGILGVFRGYFQSYRNMFPTSISQIIEQIFNAVVSLLAAWLFIRSFAASDEESIAVWGAAGGTVGTGAGVVVALLFMLLVYSLNKPAIKRRIKSDKRSHIMSSKEILRLILMMVTPIIVSAFIYNVSGYLNSYIFSEIMGRKGLSELAISALSAEYTQYFMTIINVPMTLSNAASTSLIPEIAALYSKKDIRGANKIADDAIQMSMFISIPATIGIIVLAHPIVSLLFRNTTGTAGYLLMIGAVTVVLTSLSNITNGMMQGIGKPRVPMKNAAIALGLDIILVVVLLFTTNLGIYAVLIAMLAYSTLICVLNDLSVKKHLGYKNKWRGAYLNPFLASLPMGLSAWAVYQLLYMLLHMNSIALFIAIIVAVVVYMITYVMISRPTPEELSKIPGGNLINKVIDKLPWGL